MKVIAIANQKGGVGKSTHAVHLACALLDAGHRVLFMDGDRSGNSSSFFEKYKSDVSSASFFQKECDASGIEAVFQNPLCLLHANGELENIHGMEGSHLGNLHDNLSSFPDGCYDFCVIDTPPVGGFTLKSIIFAADYVMLPMELKQWSIDGTIAMLQTVVGMSQEKQAIYGKPTVFLGICINMYDKSDKNQPQAIEMLKKEIGTYLMIGKQEGSEENSTVDDVIKISHKNVIEHAQNLYVPVWKYNSAQSDIRSKAAVEATKEFTFMYNYVFAKMGVDFPGLITKL